MTLCPLLTHGGIQQGLGIPEGQLVAAQSHQLALAIAEAAQLEVVLIESHCALVQLSDIVLIEGNLLHMMKHFPSECLFCIPGTIGDGQPLKTSLRVGSHAASQFAGHLAMLLLDKSGYLLVKRVNR